MFSLNRLHTYVAHVEDAAQISSMTDENLIMAGRFIPVVLVCPGDLGLETHYKVLPSYLIWGKQITNAHGFVLKKYN